MPSPPRPYHYSALILLITVGTAFPILVPVALIQILGEATFEDRPSLVIGTFLGCFAIVAVFTIWFILSANARDRGWVAAAMAPLGLSITDFENQGLKGSGVDRDRPLEVAWTPQKKGQVSAFSVSAGCRVPVRLRARQWSWFGRWLGRGWDADLLGREPPHDIDPGDPALARLRVRCDFADWGRALLADPDGRAALVRLVELTRGRAIDLELENGIFRCWSTSPPVLEITRDRVERAMAAISALAASAERVAASMALRP